MIVFGERKLEAFTQTKETQETQYEAWLYLLLKEKNFEFLARETWQKLEAFAPYKKNKLKFLTRETWQVLKSLLA